jgi:hypothetical protein
VPYGEGFNKQFACNERGVKVSTLEMRLPGQPNQYYYALNWGGGGKTGSLCETREAAIAQGITEARIQRDRLQTDFQRYVDRQAKEASD